MTDTSSAVPPEDSIIHLRRASDFHKQASAEFQLAADHFSRGLEFARQVGLELIAAKKLCHPKRWQSLVQDHCHFSIRTDQLYRQIAREWDRLCQLAPSRQLTLEKAAKLLAKNRKSTDWLPLNVKHSRQGTQVDRAALLQILESLKPGLCEKEWIEQSSCFVFKDGDVFTYNGEVWCQCQCKIGVTGAVPARILVSVLSALPDRKIVINATDDHFVISGVDRTASIKYERGICLPMEHLELPGHWKDLPEEFSKAVEMVIDSAGHDAQKFVSTCIHIHPDWIEATDHYKIARYQIKTDVREECLVKKETLKHVLGHDFTTFSETATGLHFQDEFGLIMSCLRYVERYPVLSQHFELSGEKITLPAEFAKAVRNAAILTPNNPADHKVFIALKPGEITVQGKGENGEYTEKLVANHEVSPCRFFFPPEQLISYLKQTSEYQISEGSLRCDVGQCTFIHTLETPEDR